MDGWMKEHFLSIGTVLDVSAYIPQMLTGARTHRHPAADVVMCPPLYE